MGQERHEPLSEQAENYLAHERLLAQAFLGLSKLEHTTPREITSFAQAFLGLPIDDFSEKVQAFLNSEEYEDPLKTNPLVPNHYPETKEERADPIEILNNPNEIIADPRKEENKIDLSNLGLYYLSLICNQEPGGSLPDDLKSLLPKVDEDIYSLLQEALTSYIKPNDPNKKKERKLKNLNLLGLYIFFPLSYADIGIIDGLIENKETISIQAVKQKFDQTWRSLLSYNPEKQQISVRKPPSKIALLKYVTQEKPTRTSRILQLLLVYGIDIDKIEKIMEITLSRTTIHDLLEKHDLADLVPLRKKHLSRKIKEKLEEEEDPVKIAEAIGEIKTKTIYMALKESGLIINIQDLLKKAGFLRNPKRTKEIFKFLKDKGIICGQVTYHTGSKKQNYYFIPIQQLEYAIGLINNNSTRFNLRKDQKKD